MVTILDSVRNPPISRFSNGESFSPEKSEFPFDISLNNVLNTFDKNFRAITTRLGLEEKSLTFKIVRTLLLAYIVLLLLRRIF